MTDVGILGGVLRFAQGRLLYEAYEWMLEFMSFTQSHQIMPSPAAAEGQRYTAKRQIFVPWTGAASAFSRDFSRRIISLFLRAFRGADGVQAQPC